MEHLRSDVIAVAPPEKGLGENMIASVGELRHELQKAEGVDLFPRMAHIETVALLSQNRNETGGIIT